MISSYVIYTLRHFIITEIPPGDRVIHIYTILYYTILYYTILYGT